MKTIKVSLWNGVLTVEQSTIPDGIIVEVTEEEDEGETPHIVTKYTRYRADNGKTITHRTKSGSIIHSSKVLTDPAKRTQFNRCSTCGNWFEPTPKD